MIYALAALITFYLIINKLSQKFSLYNISYKRSLSSSVVEVDEEFQITTTVINRKLLPVSFLQIGEKLPQMFEQNKEFHTMRMIMLPFQRISRTYTLKAARRGNFTFSLVQLTAGDFLGINTFDKEFEYNNRILVLPGSLDIEKNLLPYGSFYGNISVIRWIIDDPVIISGLREYTGTEPEKTIHWPSSLRTGKLMVKKFDYTTDSRVLIILNIESYKPFWMKIQSVEIERCISYTRALMEMLEQANIPYAFATNANLEELSSEIEFVPAGLGTVHFNNILERLAYIDYSVKLPFEELIEVISERPEDYVSIVAVTPSVFDEYLEPLKALCRASFKTALISLKDNNIENIDPSIVTFVERKS